MRQYLFKALSDVAKKDKNIFFITADLGFGFVEHFAKEHSDNFLNIGVAEQAMLGIGNGLASAGKKVICYSIATFSLIRPFEFFRNGAIAQRNSVMVVGVGPGFDYSYDGLSHYCLEDLAVTQSQLNLKIKTPFKKEEVYDSIIEFSKTPEPTYLRLPRVQPDLQVINLESLSVSAIDVLILTTTLMANRAQSYESEIKKKGLRVRLCYVPEISKKFDEIILEHLSRTRLFLVVEDHYTFGGLGTRISNLMTQNNISSDLIIDAVINSPTGTIGSYEFMTKKLMMDEKQILNEIFTRLI